MPKHGFDEAAWEAAKTEAKSALAERARIRQVVAYSDFIKLVHAITFTDPQDPRLKFFLEEISIEENRCGRGMLTALVVHKHGDYMPGPGYFELAKKLGRNTKDIEKCWVDELNTIYRAWPNVNKL